MRNVFFIVGILLYFTSCNKTVDSSQVAQEKPIAFSIDASNATISPSSNFAVTVTLTSTIPSSQGIKIEAIVSDQTNNNSITQNPAISNTNIKNTISLINLPQQHWCNATIRVSSVATPTNTSSQNFTVVYK